MRKKLFSFCFLLCLVILLYNTCGLEDTLIYYQEPRNIEVDDSVSDDVIVKFYGYNQETDGENYYMFVGYDVYYYISSPSNAKKAQVLYPMVSSHSDYYLPTEPEVSLIDFSNEELATNVDRFPGSNFSNNVMENFYQYVSIPVTIDMIDNILEKGNNDNVRFSFTKYHGSKSSIDNPDELSENAIMLYGLYPAYEEYDGSVDWADESDDDFRGFYDADYYYLKFGEKLTVDKSYKVYFYIVAKGFQSFTDRTLNFTESVKSDVFSVTFEVDKDTLDIP